MPKKFEVRYLETAENDLYDIFDYVVKENPKAAADLIEKINKKIKNLENNPEIDVTPKDLKLKSMGYRALVIDKYIAFYVIKDNIIQIRRIFHGARDYQFIL